MISRNLITDALMIVVLIALQIFLLNRITIAGRFSPVLFPVFVMFYPFYRNKYQFLAMSCLLGMGIDAFLGTWGINAFATTLIAYFRTVIFRTSTETSTDFFSFQALNWPQFLLFIFSSLLIHQFMVQYIEFFKLSRFFEVLLNILVTTIISFIFGLFYILIFKIKEKV